MSPVAAAQPITGGSAPAAPPMTMFCGVLPLQPHRVHDDVEEDREGEQRGRCDIERESKNGDCAAGENKSECKRFGARDLAARDRPPGRAGHHRVDVGVVPHVEHAGGAGSRGDCENCNGPKQRIEVTRRNHQSDERGEHRKQPSRAASSARRNPAARGQAGPRRQLQARDGNRCAVHDEILACPLLLALSMSYDLAPHTIPRTGDRALRRRGMGRGGVSGDGRQPRIERSIGPQTSSTTLAAMRW